MSLGPVACVLTQTCNDYAPCTHPGQCESGCTMGYCCDSPSCCGDSFWYPEYSYYDTKKVPGGWTCQMPECTWEGEWIDVKSYNCCDNYADFGYVSLSRSWVDEGAAIGVSETEYWHCSESGGDFYPYCGVECSSLCKGTVMDETVTESTACAPVPSGACHAVRCGSDKSFFKGTTAPATAEDACPSVARQLHGFSHLASYGGPPETQNVGECRDGLIGCTSGAESCVGWQGPFEEVCGNGLDEDCDGLVDEDCL